MLLNQVKIIAGQWRGRSVQFADQADLRPTGNRIRETLFNWLQFDIAGAVCLDLFAGSGILSFEALSRGAEKILALDTSSTVIQQLQQQAKNFQTHKLVALQQNAYDWLQHSPAHWQTRYPQRVSSQYDIVFIDPPFNDHRLTDICAGLTDHHWLKPNAFIYVEKSLQQSFAAPDQWALLKDKKAGAVSYQLYQLQ